MWIYIQSIIVYISIAAVGIYYSNLYSKTGKYKYVIYALLYYSVIFGIRYGVGADYFSYVHGYETISRGQSDYITERWELGFLYLTKFLSIFHSNVVFLGTISFIQLFLFISAFRDKPKVYSYLFFVFAIGCTWMSFSNLLRQVIAAGFWILSLKYATERKLVWHYAMIAVAALFHNSSLTLIVFYPLITWKAQWFRQPKAQLLLLFGSLVLMQLDLVQSFISRIDYFIQLLGYNNYYTFKDELIETETRIGIGFYVSLMLNVLSIYYSKQVKEYFGNRHYNAIYDFYVIGIIVSNIFVSSQLIGRMIYFFTSLSFIIYAFSLCYLKENHCKRPYLIFVSCVCLIFIAVMYRASENWALYVFNWQDEYFHFHRLHEFN